MANTPRFDAFKQHYQAGRWAQALVEIDALAASQPGHAPTHWHRANTLEQLERHAEAADAIDRVLALAPDYVPALLKRVELSAYDGRTFDPVPPLRRAIAIEPGHARAHWLLSRVLGDGDEATAAAALDRAIELDAGLHEALADRGERRRGAAMRGFSADADAPDDPDVIATFAGPRWSRSGLLGALADFEAAARLKPELRYHVRCGDLLHTLGRHDEALARFDAALALLAADDPRRGTITEMRERSERGGAGEREQMARLLVSGLEDGEDGDRSLEDQSARDMMQSLARAVRGGQRIDQAVEELVSDDPTELLALQVAQGFYNVAFEAEPGLVDADPARYPRYQRRFGERAGRELEAAGFRHEAWAEAEGMFPTLGQHVLLRFLADPAQTTFAACFAMRPKWPGWLAFLILSVLGKWRTATMVEFVTHFDDGTFLSTQNESISPFEWGGRCVVRKVPPRMPLAERAAVHAQAVAEHLASHPQARPIRREGLEGIEEGWIASSLAKREFRRSIGFATDAELRQMLGARHDELAPKVRRKLEVLVRDA